MQRLSRRRTSRSLLAVSLVTIAHSPMSAQEHGPQDLTIPSDAEPTDPAITAAEPPQQISEYIREIFQDRAGNLWFGTNGIGVCRYDGAELTYFDQWVGFGGQAIRGIDQADDGAMWFATNLGLCRMQDGEFTNYSMADGLNDSSVWSLLIDRNGTVWAGTHEGVTRFDGETFESFPLPRIDVESPASRFSPKVVFAMLEDSAGNLWFGTDGEGVHRYDGNAFTSYTTADGLAGDQVRAIEEDRQGVIWIGTNGGGVSTINGTTIKNYTEADGLNNNRVYEIYETNDGALWFSTLGAGASRYDGNAFTPVGEAQGLTMNHLPCPCGSGSIFKDCHGPNGAHVQAFYEDTNGEFWFGCSGGLFRLVGDRVVNVTRDGPWPDASE